MYTQYNPLPELETKATEFIMDNDRMLYSVFFVAAEAFCVANSVLLGGRVGIDLLVGRPLTKESFFWELYCDDTFNIAKNFVIELSRTHSPHIPANTTSLQTNIRHKEFSVFINARLLFKIYSMDKYRGIKLIELMGPATRTSYFTKNPIKCIAEEMQLISIYRTLYSPAKLPHWKDAIENEQKIYDLIKEAIGVKATTSLVTGGASAKLAAKNIHLCLIRDLIKPNSYILIGDHAMTAMGLLDSGSRVQFIAPDDIDDIRKKCERCILRRDTDIKITYMRYQLNLPDDFQILKYTLYLNDKDGQVAIADIFNSSAFEPIPFARVGGIRVGNPWVLLRFIFIDIWVLKLILNLDQNAADFIKTKITDNLSRADMLREKIFKNIAETFQLVDYGGRYVDETVAKKKLIKERGERFPIFYPSLAAEPQVEGGAERFTSAAVDLSIDVETKKRILMKIVGRVIDNDVLKTLEYYYNLRQSADDTKWGVGKSLKGFFYKNKPFLRFIPQKIENYVDIGCGAGLDIAAMRQTYKISVATCVDIDDFRDDKYAKDSIFVGVRLGEPIDIPDDYADLVVVFHSIHHMRESVESRLKDIVRLTRPGGMIFIKDHDVDSPAKVSNVDFEHLVYMAGGDGPWVAAGGLVELIKNFNKYEPMTYYSRDEIHKILGDNDCKLIWTGDINKRTYAYGSVFEKK